MSTQPSYVVPRDYQDYTTEQEIKRSRFICHLRRADSEDDARQHVADIRKAYPDARHHCSAFITAASDEADDMPDKVNAPLMLIERSSDDGEPAGTAGQPMLNVLRESGMTNVCAVVVRYFGGTKLGAGGLVRAYSDSVAQTVSIAPTSRRRRALRMTFIVSISDAGRVESALRSDDWSVEPTVYGAGAPEDARPLDTNSTQLNEGSGGSGNIAQINVVVSPSDVDAVVSAVAALTQGVFNTYETGITWRETST